MFGEPLMIHGERPVPSRSNVNQAVPLSHQIALPATRVVTFRELQTKAPRHKPTDDPIRAAHALTIAHSRFTVRGPLGLTTSETDAPDT